jgi:type II secretory pathway pseudopilin PulG
MITSAPAGFAHRRSGITLTEILIAIMILGVGLVSLATLFPIGLLRLRDATRYTRSALLLQSAAADTTARGLVSSNSFPVVDSLNLHFGLTQWYWTRNSGSYNPLVQDTPSYYGDWQIANPNPITVGAHASGGPGLPFAYDPLWRFYTINPAHYYANDILDANGNPTQPGGYYMGDTGALEARFGSGIGFIRHDPSDNGVPSAHGLQRLTNFNRPYVTVNGRRFPMMPASLAVPSIFVSQEDLVWQDPNVNNFYTIDGISPNNNGIPVSAPSPVVPDLNTGAGSPSLDWRYSWIFTGKLISAHNSSTFDGDIVILENRPFGISVPDNPPYPFAAYPAQQVAGEIVVEAIFGYSRKVSIVNPYVYGYAAGADRTVLLRWPVSIPDPVVRPGDWIADVTYERVQATAINRFLSYGQPLGGVPNNNNNLEWDNLPAQRCIWYQVQKVSQASTDPFDPLTFRSIVVYVNQPLQAKTLLQANGQPWVLNAALIAPNVVNVIPQTIFVR